MNAIRKLLGYTIWLVILIAIIKFSFDAIAVETGEYVQAPQVSRPALLQRSASSSEPETREAGANPVWIAPTPKYQYDPKLMEVKPPHELRKEAELRRKQMQAQNQTRQHDAKLRHKPIAEKARKAMASAGERAAPSIIPPFLMFSPH
jgi:hypothetical protein